MRLSEGRKRAELAGGGQRLISPKHPLLSCSEKRKAVLI